MFPLSFDHFRHVIDVQKIIYIEFREDDISRVIIKPYIKEQVKTLCPLKSYKNLHLYIDKEIHHWLPSEKKNVMILIPFFL